MVALCLVFLAVVFSMAECLPPISMKGTIADPGFHAWKAMANPTYSTLDEEHARYDIFLKNKALVDRHNAKNLGFTVALNQFADKSPDEVNFYFKGLRVPQFVPTEPTTTPTTPKPTTTTSKMTTTQKPTTTTSKTTTKTTAKTTTTTAKATTTTTKATTTTTKLATTTTTPSGLPASWDWRTKGGVSPVRNQGSCGSCWAFSVAGAIESQLRIKMNQTVTLSVQQMIECAGGYGNAGCSGGWPDGAFSYVAQVGGLNTESSYPYLTSNGVKCHVNSGALYGKLNKTTPFVDVTKGSEKALMAAVIKAPVIVLFDASQSLFSYYSTGIYNDKTCTQSVDHAMLLVGYGSQNGVNYWIVKNSWGTWWGEQGYIRVARDGTNKCGILSYPSYPVLA